MACARLDPRGREIGGMKTFSDKISRDHSSSKERASMRWLAKICLLVLVPGLALAQTNAQNAPSDPTSVASELKALREAMAQQQQQIAQQQQQIDTLEKALESKTAGTPHVEDATLHTNLPAAADGSTVAS